MELPLGKSVVPKGKSFKRVPNVVVSRITILENFNESSLVDVSPTISLIFIKESISKFIRSCSKTNETKLLLSSSKVIMLSLTIS